MRAYDIAGRRGGLGITQIELGKRLDWSQEVVRAVEVGKVDITNDQYMELQRALDEIVAEKQSRQPEAAVA